jgi:hypothetical protein
MVSLDIFNQDAFSFTSLVAAIDKVPYSPSFLRNLNLCMPKPVTTKTVAIEERGGTIGLVQTSQRGSPAPSRATEKRNVRSFETVRIAKKDRIMGDEIANLRAFGSETDTQTVQNEVMRRMSGPVGLQSEIELTWEHMLLGMVQGIVLDADGSVIVNWYDEFGIDQPDEIAFDLTGAQAASTSPNGALKLKPFLRQNVVRPMQQAAGGAFNPSTQIYALCGSDFYDAVTSHGDVARAYGNWSNTKPSDDSGAFEVFYWGGVNWCDYRGTDDGSTVAVTASEVKFFPVNAPGVFINAWAPGEGINGAGAPGVPLLPVIDVDPSNLKEWADIHLRSYPLHICSRPEILLRGKAGA